ncbi:hypothetical protein HY772_01600, partial [Candidatus Woesearchaeota archaeon]|nr:hypothetical protein [Candidatus Woesearchaeota archaeon]
EALLQNIAYARKVLMRRNREDEFRKKTPMPSFFNAHNLAIALAQVGEDKVPADSTAGRLRRKLEELPLPSIEERKKGVSLSSNNLVVKVMSDLFNGQSMQKDLTEFLEGRVSWNFSAATNYLLERLKEIASFLLGSEQSHPHPKVEAEEKVVRRIAEEMLQENEDNNIADSLPTDEAERLILSLAHLSAIASMYAHTFSPTDCYRLMFIAGHVCQVLDNHLMRQARQRRIPAGYTEFATLGLDLFAFEALDEIKMISPQIVRGLKNLVERDFAKQGMQDITVVAEELNLEKFFAQVCHGDGKAELDIGIASITVQSEDGDLGTLPVVAVINERWNTQQADKAPSGINRE